MPRGRSNARTFPPGLSPGVFQIHSSEYRNPKQVPSGPVLVVGAGNSGAQIAEELARERRVYLSAGKKPPYLPQRFLGKDLFWWLYKLGLMDVTDNSRVGMRMRQNDPLIGTDLRRLVRELGVELVGRTDSARDRSISFSDGRRIEVTNIIWATGFRPDYDWIEVPVFDEKGIPIHKRGVTSAHGLYFLGLPWQHTRGSALLGGVGRDANYLAEIIASCPWVQLRPHDARHDFKEGSGQPMPDLRKESLPAAEQDTCEVTCYDPEKVQRLRDELEGTQGLALIFKALADDTRVQIALALSKEELCVCDVAALMGVTEATASHHLRLLRNMGLAKYRKQGKMVFYSLDDGHVVSIIRQAMEHFREGKAQG